MFRIIGSIESLAGIVSVAHEDDGKLSLTRDNFALHVLEPVNGTFPDQIVQTGSGLDIGDDVDFSPRMSAGSSPGSLASVTITEELVEIFVNNTPPGEPPQLIVVAYDVSSPLFQDPINRNGTGSIILSVLQSNSASPAGLEELLDFQFQTNQVLFAEKHA